MDNSLINFQNKYISSDIIWKRTDIYQESDQIKINDINHLLNLFKNLKKIKKNKISIKILQYLKEYFNYIEAIHSYFYKYTEYTDNLFYFFQIINSENLILLKNNKESCWYYYFENFNSISLYFLDYMLPHLKDINDLKKSNYEYYLPTRILATNYSEEYQQLFQRLMPKLSLNLFDNNKYNIKNFLNFIFPSKDKNSIKIIKIISPLLTQEFFDMHYHNNSGSMWLSLASNINQYTLEKFEYLISYLKVSYFKHKFYKGATIWKVVFSQIKDKYHLKFIHKFDQFLNFQDLISMDGLGNNIYHILFSNLYNKYSVKIFKEYLLYSLYKNPWIYSIQNKRKETCLHCLFENISIYSYNIFQIIFDEIDSSIFLIQNIDGETCLHLLFKQIDRKLNIKLLKQIIPLLTIDMLIIKNCYNKTPLHYFLLHIDNNNIELNKIFISCFLIAFNN